MNEMFDLAIVGAGPAGLAALIAAGEASEQRMHIALLDNRPQPGGQYYLQPPLAFQPLAFQPPAFQPPHRSAVHHRAEAQAVFARAQAIDACRLLDTDVWNISPLKQGGWQLDLRMPDGLGRLEARGVILAVGAYDRPVPFPGWTLPGVMTAGAVQNLLKSQGVLPGQRIVVSGSGPLSWAVAANLVEAGAHGVALLEAAPRLLRRALPHGMALWGQWARVCEGIHYWRVLRRARVPICVGWAAIAAHGEQEVRAVEIARLAEDWSPLAGVENRRTLEADTLVVGYGFTPATQLSRLIGCRHVLDPSGQYDIPVRSSEMASSQPAVWIVGDGARIGGAALAQIEGQIAGLAAAGALGFLKPDHTQALINRLHRSLRREQRFADMLAALFTPRAGWYALAQEDTLICRCEDVSLGKIKAAVQSGAQTVNEVKGLTRAGMGFCQGRLCGDSVARVVHAVHRSPVRNRSAAPEPATPRPPLWPLSLTELSAPIKQVTPACRPSKPA
ncbi:MAG: NAD(P)/FAD-dependent oxidoreductase [Anaerolineae bacterium]|nr:NAD(P)/FAD-dependent oxidoreductase [Thermoflexales bacterium]MDW8408386.1 NAD(P)/FAD-dependent oxidoreductase [Anaerolineae bacterium]